MKKIFSSFILFSSKIIGRKNLENLLIFSAKTINTNLHLHGLIQNGGVSSYDSQVNGEQLFIRTTLSDLFNTETKPVFFDVGANIGDFSLELRSSFPNAEIHSFEPVPTTFDALVKNTGGHQIISHNIGLSDTIGTGELFNTVSRDNNTIASAYKDVFHEIFNTDDELGAITFQMDTIDSFCHSEHITNIDFLKIDVEGHEFSVLSGAANMLVNENIKVIQFEFNSHNVYSRVFLRDFYLILKDFEFYRIVRDGLIKLGPYNHLNEIFALQNIVVVRKDICHLIKEASFKISS